MDKFTAITVFRAITKNGSMTNAAESLGKSLPTVVRTLANLESTLGVRLFNRTTRQIALTEEGRVYLAYTERMTEEMSAVENQLRGDREAPSGTVHVTAPHLFGEEVLTPVVSELLSRYPCLNVRLLLLDRVVDMVHEQMDIAVRIGHLPDSSLVARKVGEVRSVLCASPSFIEKYSSPSDLEDIAGKPCVTSSGSSADRSWRFGAGAKPVLVPTSAKMICNTIRPTIQACLDGHGLGLFYSYQVFNQIRDGRLRLLLPEFERPPSPVHLVYPHSSLLSVRVQSVMEELASALKPLLKQALILSPRNSLAE